MVVDGVRSRSTNSCGNEYDCESYKYPKCDKDVFRGIRLAGKRRMNLGKLQQQGAVRFIFEHQACRRYSTHLSSKTFQKPTISRRESEKY